MTENGATFAHRPLVGHSKSYVIRAPDDLPLRITIQHEKSDTQKPQPPHHHFAWLCSASIASSTPYTIRKLLSKRRAQTFKSLVRASFELHFTVASYRISHIVSRFGWKWIKTTCCWCIVCLTSMLGLCHFSRKRFAIWHAHKRQAHLKHRAISICQSCIEYHSGTSINKMVNTQIRFNISDLIRVGPEQYN